MTDEIPLSEYRINAKIGGLPDYNNLAMQAMKANPWPVVEAVLDAMMEVCQEQRETDPRYDIASVTLEQALGIVRDEQGDIKSARVGWMAYRDPNESELMQEPVAVFRAPLNMDAQIVIGLVNSVVQKLEQQSSTVVFPPDIAQEAQTISNLNQTLRVKISIPANDVSSLHDIIEFWQNAVDQNAENRKAANLGPVYLTLGILEENGVITLEGERNPARDPKDTIFAEVKAEEIWERAKAEGHAERGKTWEQAKAKGHVAIEKVRRLAEAEGHAQAEAIWKKSMADTCEIFTKAAHLQEAVQPVFEPVAMARQTLRESPGPRSKALEKLLATLQGFQETQIQPDMPTSTALAELPEGLKNQEFYVVRHGESESQTANRVGGGTDNAGLSPKGIEQANELATLLQEIGGDRMDRGMRTLGCIIHSGMTRTHDTALPASQRLNIPCHPHPDLHDWELGEMAMESRDQYKGVNLYQLLETNPPPGGETPVQFYNRSNAASDNALAVHESEGIAVMVAHQATLVALCEAAGCELKEAYPANAQVFHLVPDPSGKFPWKVSTVALEEGIIRETPVLIEEKQEPAQAPQVASMHDPVIQAGHGQTPLSEEVVVEERQQKQGGSGSFHKRQSSSRY
ncbi:MAG TPA: histidine phosphatase family protein [Ktedonobacteraceae bacterium]|nr:histidine phosphatase family protein [Ktedonobacteraceae bacterium]